MCCIPVCFCGVSLCVYVHLCICAYVCTCVFTCECLLHMLYSIGCVCFTVCAWVCVYICVRKRGCLVHVLAHTWVQNKKNAHEPPVRRMLVVDMKTTQSEGRLGSPTYFLSNNLENRYRCERLCTQITQHLMDLETTYLV